MRTSWLDAQFGANAPGLRTGIALGLSVANDEAGREYTGSRFKKRPVFGTARYYYSLDAVAHALERTANAHVLVLHGRPYAVVDGTLIYPWCYANTTELDHRDVPVSRVSDFKLNLFAARTASRQRRQTWIDFIPMASGLEAMVNEAELDDDRGVSAMLVAFSSNPRAGLLKVIAGDVELYADGHLHWNKEEELAIEQAVAGDLSITRREIVETLQRFDELPEPDIDIDFHDDEGGAAGESIKDTHYDDPERPDEEEGPNSDSAQ